MEPNDLRTLREKLKLTQQKLAEKLQIPANTISRWERGDMAIQHPELLRLAVEHLSCKSCRQNSRH